MEFFTQMFFKTTLLIEIRRLRVFLMIFHDPDRLGIDLNSKKLKMLGQFPKNPVEDRFPQVNLVMITVYFIRYCGRMHSELCVVTLDTHIMTPKYGPKHDLTQLFNKIVDITGHQFFKTDWKVENYIFFEI